MSDIEIEIEDDLDKLSDAAGYIDGLTIEDIYSEELKAETGFPEGSQKQKGWQFKSETATSSSCAKQIEEQNLVTEFGSQRHARDGVTKVAQYISDHIYIIKEYIKIGGYHQAKRSRLSMEEVPGVRSLKPSSAEASSRDTSFHNEADLPEHKRMECYATEGPVEENQRSLLLPKAAHVCKTCNESFVYFTALKLHTFVHKGREPHKCDTCGKSFIRLSALKIHTLIHEGKRPHKCEFCEKSFTQISVLNRHKLIHTSKRSHECKVCGKNFASSGNLKRHNLSHEGRKPFDCKACDKSLDIRHI